MLKGACKLASYQDGHAISHDLCKVHGITFPSLQVAGRESRIPLKGYYEWHIPDDDGSSPAQPVPKPLFKKVVIKVSQGRKIELRQSGQSEGKHINSHRQHCGQGLKGHYCRIIRRIR